MKNKLHLLATIIASLLLVQGCMKESIEFDTDGPVRTVLYTAPPSALPATILSVSRVVDVAHNFGTFGDIRYDPDSLPAFVGPPEDWVKDAGLTVRYETSHDRKVCIIEPRAGVSKYIFFMHGGGYILNTDEKQYNFFKQAIEELGYGLIVPDYPLCAAYVYTDAYDMLHDVYLDWVARAGADNIIFFGDSAGGALVIGMAQYLRDKGEPLPRAVIGFSPWLDATLTNEDIHLVDDVIMPLAQLQNCGLLWAGDDNPRTYRVSPIYGDFQGLPPLHIFIGGRDMFYADVAKLRERMKKEKLPLTVYEYPHMFHVWADLLPQMPESKDAIKHIVKILKEN